MSDELKIGADTAENELLAKHLAKFAKSLPYERSQAGEAREEALRAEWQSALRAAVPDKEANVELNFAGGKCYIEFSPKLRGARSRLNRRRFLQVNTRWKALAEIYTMHSFAPFLKLKISAKNRQHFFAIEY